MATPDAFRLAFESYNRNLNFMIDMSQKCITLVLAFLGVFVSLHKTEDCHGPISWNSFVLIFVVAMASLGLFAWMQGKYRERCENCILFLTAYDKADLGVDLQGLGIISGEHGRIIRMWSIIFAGFLIAMLVFVGLYQWNGVFGCAPAPPPYCAATPSAAGTPVANPHYRQTP